MSSATQENKSTFVTVIAWIGIVITGFSTCISALQNIMFNVLMDDKFDEAMKMSDPDMQENMPAFASFMFSHFDLMLFLIFLLSFISLIASIGLLKRKNWARLIIIVMLGLGIVWNLAGFAFQQSMMDDMIGMQENAFEQMEERARIDHEKQLTNAEFESCCEKTDPCCKKPITWEERQQKLEKQKAEWKSMNNEFDGMMSLFMIIGIVMIVIFSAIQGWIIWKLTRPEIVGEFKRNIST